MIDNEVSYRRFLDIMLSMALLSIAEYQDMRLPLAINHTLPFTVVVAAVLRKVAERTKAEKPTIPSGDDDITVVPAEGSYAISVSAANTDFLEFLQDFAHLLEGDLFRCGYRSADNKFALVVMLTEAGKVEAIEVARRVQAEGSARATHFSGTIRDRFTGL